MFGDEQPVDRPLAARHHQTSATATSPTKNASNGNGSSSSGHGSGGVGLEGVGEEEDEEAIGESLTHIICTYTHTCSPIIHFTFLVYYF